MGFNDVNLKNYLVKLYSEERISKQEQEDIDLLEITLRKTYRQKEINNIIESFSKDQLINILNVINNKQIYDFQIISNKTADISFKNKNKIVSKNTIPNSSDKYVFIY